MKRMLVVVGLMAMSAACFGGMAHEEMATRTEARAWTNEAGKAFLYRWHAPKAPEAGKTYPLVIFMHGAGERGTNNVMQLAWCAKEIFDYMKASGKEFYFVAGQVPANTKWVLCDWAALAHAMPAKPSPTMELQIEFLEDLFAKTPGIDRSRVYVSGISMGGYGTWDLLCRRPEWFAAAMPVCGGVDLAQLWRLRDIPIWTHHGDRDTTVPFVRSRQATATLWACDGKIRYTEYPGCGHASWIPAFGTKAHLDWLFSQKKQVPADK